VASPLIAPTKLYQHQLPCGLTILGQMMPWLRSASFAIAVPAGSQFERKSEWGLAGFVCEMVQRGAGPYSSRDVVALADNLGLDRTSSVSTAHTSLGASLPAQSLLAAIDLFAHVVLRPHLPSDQMEDARSVSLQELRAAEDEPAQRVMMRLKEKHYGEGLGHSLLGTATSLQQIDHDAVKRFFQTHYQPSDAIFSVAGSFDWPEVVGEVERLFGNWAIGEQNRVPERTFQPGYEHIEHPSQQTHIGFSFPALAYDDPDYFTLRAAVGVLSDGMSSRLFDRVREQRGLCYTVSASTHSLRGCGGVFGYAGTTPQRAQETLDVTLAEIRKLGVTVQDDELDRFKVRIQSQLVMQQESSGARAAAMATDWYYLGRMLQPSEIEAKIDAVTPAEIAMLWERLGLGEMCIVTLGPERLVVSS